MPWPRDQAIAIMMDANRKGKARLAKKARDSLRGKAAKTKRKAK